MLDVRASDIDVDNEFVTFDVVFEGVEGEDHFSIMSHGTGDDNQGLLIDYDPDSRVDRLIIIGRAVRCPPTFFKRVEWQGDHRVICAVAGHIHAPIGSASMHLRFSTSSMLISALAVPRAITAPEASHVTLSGLISGQSWLQKCARTPRTQPLRCPSSFLVRQRSGRAETDGPRTANYPIAHRSAFPSSARCSISVSRCRQFSEVELDAHRFVLPLLVDVVLKVDRGPPPVRLPDVARLSSRIPPCTALRSHRADRSWRWSSGISCFLRLRTIGFDGIVPLYQLLETAPKSTDLCHFGVDGPVPRPRRHHVLRLIPSVSQGLAASTDMVRYSSRGLAPSARRFACR